MSKTANIFTRVEPKIKEQAETVLSQLGMSMATAMEIYLRQIVLQRKIPFEMALPDSQPIALGALTNDEFNGLMERAFQQYREGKCSSVDEVEARLVKELDI